MLKETLQDMGIISGQEKLFRQAHDITCAVVGFKGKLLLNSYYVEKETLDGKTLISQFVGREGIVEIKQNVESQSLTITLNF